MSDFHSPEAEAHFPRFESWLAVLGASFVPAVLTAYVPPALRMPLIAATALLLVVGLAMLVRETRRRRAELRASNRVTS